MKYSDYRKLFENKDRFIDVNPNLTPEQKTEIKAFFAKHPNYESKLDWNKAKFLTYEDFKPVLDLEGKSVSAVKKGAGIEGLTEGHDYVELGSGVFKGEEWHAYQPFTYYASRLIASKYVKPAVEAQWCTAYQKNRAYWDHHCFDSNESMIYFLGESIPTKKVAVTASTAYEDADGTSYSNIIRLDKNNRIYYNIWDAQDDPYEVIPSELPGNITQMCVESLKNMPKVKELHEEDLAKSEEIAKQIAERERQARLPHLNRATRRYDVNASMTGAMLREYVEDGKFKIPFGVIEGNFHVPEDVISLENCPTEVHGNFSCRDNDFIKSLAGGPRVVTGYYRCSCCTSLETLEGAPEEVGGTFICEDCNKLRNLKGGPKKVGWDYRCSFCKLESLEGGPETVGKSFDCSYNTWLKSLKGGPAGLVDTYNCKACSLENLEGAPDTAKFFDCSENHLESLKGGPKVVVEFNCSHNWELNSLEGGPTYVRLYACENCSGQFTPEMVRAVCHAEKVRT